MIMNNKKIVATLLGISLLAVGVGTYAYQGTPGTQNPDCTDTERHTAVTQMFADKDYSSFQSLFADKGVARKITSEDQFLKFADLHAAKLAGDQEKMDALKADLGLGQRNGSGQGKWEGMRGKRKWSGNRDGSGNRRSK